MCISRRSSFKAWSVIYAPSGLRICRVDQIQKQGERQASPAPPCQLNHCLRTEYELSVGCSGGEWNAESIYVTTSTYCNLNLYTLQLCAQSKLKQVSVQPFTSKLARVISVGEAVVNPNRIAKWPILTFQPKKRYTANLVVRNSAEG